MKIRSLQGFAAFAVLSLLLPSRSATAGESTPTPVVDVPVLKPTVSQRAGRPIRTIHVEGFRSPGNKWLEQFLTDRVGKEFVRAGSFQVVEREKLSAIIQEKALVGSGICSGDSCHQTPLELKEIDAIILGVVDADGNGGGVVELRMVDSKTGIVLQLEESSYQRDVEGGWRTFVEKGIEELVGRFR